MSSTAQTVNSEIILLSHHYPDTPAEQLTLGVGVVMSSTAQMSTVKVLLSHHYPDTPAEQLTLGVGVVMSSNRLSTVK